MTPKITDADRQRWLMRPDTCIDYCYVNEEFVAAAFRRRSREHFFAWLIVCRRTTKTAAINAAIRAERKARK